MRSIIDWYRGLRRRWQLAIAGFVVLLVIGTLTPSDDDDGERQEPTPSATPVAVTTNSPTPTPALTATPSATPVEVFPSAADILAVRETNEISSVDFLWQEDPLSEAEQCVRSREGPTRCFAFRSVAAHSAPALGGEGEFRRAACWDGFASSEAGEDGRGSAPPAPPRGACPQNPLGLPDGFWPVPVPDADSELVFEPEGELRRYEVVQHVDQDSLCRAALATITDTCAAVEASELSLAFEPVIIDGKVHLMPLTWDFRVLVVAPKSCHAVDIFPGPERAPGEWLTTTPRLGLRFGTSSLPRGDPGRCPA